MRKVSYRKEFPLTEGTYRNMMSRCYNSNATGYKYYGGKGIGVCDRWAGKIGNFILDMGVRPANKTLDRIDNERDYSKENCRWATNIQQSRNTSRNRVISYNGNDMCVSEWAEVVNIKPNTLEYRIIRGWSVEEALGFKKREKGYIGKIDVDDMMRKIDGGMMQIEYAAIAGVDSSQISRIYRKTKKENAIATERRRHE